MKLAPVLMVQGTASSVGKSAVVTGLCRLFARRGWRVAPFKAQNMALNAAVTAEGLEIGRAQAAQAEAAGVAATVAMNPVLLKPEAERRAQVVVMGKSIGSLSAAEYHTHKPHLRTLVSEALVSLRQTHDVVVIEGAGSPAEINLREHDIVNMYIATSARAPVLLVGDIDRGGVFAAFVGTLELLPPQERELVAAFIINKFRGDKSLLQSGLDFLTERTGKPVLGVLPYLRQLRLDPEDSAALDDPTVASRPSGPHLDVAVVRLPRLSNHDDLQPLSHETHVRLRMVEDPSSIINADLVILPGSKSTVEDLIWLHERGLAATLRARAAQARPILGICGGCQMLGETLHDPDGHQSPHALTPGLGLLPFSTHFGADKLCAQVTASTAGPSFLHCEGPVQGYEIHQGHLQHHAGATPAFRLQSRNGRAVDLADGAVSQNNSVIGTLLHGLLDNTALRHALLRDLWARRGEAMPAPTGIPTRQQGYDALADMLQEHCDAALLGKLSGLGPLALEA